MELRHEFTVPATHRRRPGRPSTTSSRWPPASPGAKVTSVEGDTFTGQRQGQARPDRARLQRHRHVRREGRVGAPDGDRRQGQGQAWQRHRRRPRDRDDDRRRATSTQVEVLTDLNITGKPAQFGRGVMQDVSDKLLGQFTACLEQKVGDAGTRTPRWPSRRRRRAPARPRPPTGVAGSPTSARTTCGSITRARPRDDPQAAPRRRTTTPSTWAPPCSRSWRRPTGSRPSASCWCCVVLRRLLRRVLRRGIEHTGSRSASSESPDGGPGDADPDAR